MGVISDFIFNSGIIGNVIFWTSLVVGLIVIFWGSLFYIKWRALKFPVFEFVLLGNGKYHIETSKAGWLGRNTLLGNFIHYGKDKRMKLKDGRIIRDFSTNDYHQSKKGKCVVVVSDPTDRKIIVPIQKIENIDQKLFLALPPIDFQDAVLDNVRQTEKELKGFADNIVQLAIIGIIVVASIIAIIFVIRYAQSSVKEAGELVRDSSKTCTEAIKQAIENVLSRPSPDAP